LLGISRLALWKRRLITVKRHVHQTHEPTVASDGVNHGGGCGVGFMNIVESTTTVFPTRPIAVEMSEGKVYYVRLCSGELRRWRFDGKDTHGTTWWRDEENGRGFSESSLMYAWEIVADEERMIEFIPGDSAPED
jgi:hypothetical protein